jgi:hypothetical protein
MEYLTTQQRLVFNGIRDMAIVRLADPEAVLAANRAWEQIAPLIEYRREHARLEMLKALADGKTLDAAVLVALESVGLA